MVPAARVAVDTDGDVGYWVQVRTEGLIENVVITARLEGTVASLTARVEL